MAELEPTVMLWDKDPISRQGDTDVVVYRQGLNSGTKQDDLQTMGINPRKCWHNHTMDQSWVLSIAERACDWIAHKINKIAHTKKNTDDSSAI